MTKQEFLDHVRDLYRTGNRADDRMAAVEYGEDWTVPAMASGACCGALDDLMRALVACGAITDQEHQHTLDSV